jgi:hypothetical protein
MNFLQKDNVSYKYQWQEKRCFWKIIKIFMLFHSFCSNKEKSLQTFSFSLQERSNELKTELAFLQKEMEKIFEGPVNIFLMLIW